MPTSSNFAVFDKKKVLPSARLKFTENENLVQENFLTIESALPQNDRRILYRRTHSTLTTSCHLKDAPTNDFMCLQNDANGNVHVLRSQNEKESTPDRISLDRKGLTSVPILGGEDKLRLLSLQHNLITNLEGFRVQNFPTLVFLDIYDNQLDHINGIENLINLRVLLVGKNRLRKIEGLTQLKKIEVLDFHGNQILQVAGLNGLNELKVLNLAGNQIRIIGINDFQGLTALQELNLRRNRLRKLLGFGETPNLNKLFISNNDLQNIEEINSIAKLLHLKEIAIDNNPVFLDGDCTSFLISYLPHLSKLNQMLITEQARKAAMAWRRNKETTNAAFMDLTSDVCLNVRREEVISNARINWELLRSQTKCLTAKNSSSVAKTLKNLKPDSDFILTSFSKKNNSAQSSLNLKRFSNITTKVPTITERKKLYRGSSQDTETSSSNTSSNEFMRLPPILVPIVNKMERNEEIKMSESLSSIGPNVDSSVSSLGSILTTASSSSSASSENEFEEKEENNEEMKCTKLKSETKECKIEQQQMEATSNLSTISSTTNRSTSSNEPLKREQSQQKKTAKSAVGPRMVVHSKLNSRSATAKQKKQSPLLTTMSRKDREQGGDYLIEICGRFLNVYGQCALRFIDKNWNSIKANDVNTVKFNYVNFNAIAIMLNKLKMRFPNIDHLYFKETNICCLGQLNALAEIQGLISLYIDNDGNPITEKNWRKYAIYRLSHWGLRVINDVEITEDELSEANDEYKSLSDLVLWSLPDYLLQPLLVRLHVNINQEICEQNVKKWILNADPALKNVISKEALQWKKTTNTQDETVLRQRAKVYMTSLLDELNNTVNKLKLLDKEWPKILHEFVRNTLVDYTQLDLYMKQKILELNNSKF